MYIKYFILFFCFVSCAIACKSPQKGLQKQINQYLFQKWDVAFIATAERTATGLEMGNPTYEFTRNYERIKAFTEPPMEEKIKFQILKDSLLYPDNPKIPAMHIAKLSKDSLVLRNDNIKVSWHLFVKS